METMTARLLGDRQNTTEPNPEEKTPPTYTPVRTTLSKEDPLAKYILSPENQELYNRFVIYGVSKKENYEDFGGTSTYRSIPVNSGTELATVPTLTGKVRMKVQAHRSFYVGEGQLGLGIKNGKEYFFGGMGYHELDENTTMEVVDLDQEQIQHGNLWVFRTPTDGRYAHIAIDGQDVLLPPGTLMTLKADRVEVKDYIDISAQEIHLGNSKFYTVKSGKVVYKIENGITTALTEEGRHEIIPPATVLSYEDKEENKNVWAFSTKKKELTRELKAIVQNTEVVFTLKYSYQIVDPQKARELGEFKLHGVGLKKDEVAAPEAMIQRDVIQLVQSYEYKKLGLINTDNNQYKMSIPELGVKLQRDMADLHGIGVSNFYVSVPTNKKIHDEDSQLVVDSLAQARAEQRDVLNKNTQIAKMAIQAAIDAQTIEDNAKREAAKLAAKGTQEKADSDYKLSKAGIQEAEKEKEHKAAKEELRRKGEIEAVTRDNENQATKLSNDKSLEQQRFKLETDEQNNRAKLKAETDQAEAKAKAEEAAAKGHAAAAKIDAESEATTTLIRAKAKAEAEEIEAKAITQKAAAQQVLAETTPQAAKIKLLMKLMPGDNQKIFDYLLRELELQAAIETAKAQAAIANSHERGPTVIVNEKLTGAGALLGALGQFGSRSPRHQLPPAGQQLNQQDDHKPAVPGPYGR